MRVVIFLRSDAGTLLTGSGVQASRFADAVKRAGGDALVWPSTDPPPGKYDIAHLSSLDWPLETARQLSLARACADRVVISPLYPWRRWVDAFHERGRHGLARVAARILGLDGFMSLRNCHSALRRPELWAEAARQLGHVRQRQREILGEVDAWVLIAAEEEQALTTDFGVRARSSFVVRDGADWSDEHVTLTGLPSNFVLCAGRIETRKNQLLVAMALNKLGMAGVFTGPQNPRHRGYVRRFATLVDRSPNLAWLREVPRPKLLALYRRARAHVLATWWEELGLVSLEAAAAGCPVVHTTRSYVHEYLGDTATYWDPESGADALAGAIAEAVDNRPDQKHTEHVRETLSWHAQATALTAAYEQVLNGRATSS